MPDVLDILLIGVIPFAVSVIVLADAFKALRPEPALRDVPNADQPNRVGPFTLAPLLVLVLAPLGMQALETTFRLWPDSVTGRSPALGIIAGVAGLLVAIAANTGSRFVITAAASLAGGIGAAMGSWIFLKELPEQFLSPSAKTGVIIALGFYGGLQSVTLEATTRAVPRFAGILLWLMLFLATLGATIGYANGPFFNGPVLAVLFAAGVVAFLKPRTAVATALATSTSVFFVGFLAFVNWFGGDGEQWLMLGLLLGAGLAPGLSLLPPLRERPFAKLIAAFLPLLILGGTQAGIAVPKLLATQNAQEYGDYDY